VADNVNKKPIDIDTKEHCSRFEQFLDITQSERERAEKRRDYRDLKQWDAKQIATLNGDAICGLEVQGRTDPKALPVLPIHEKAAEVITDALRFVESRQHLDETFTECFEDKIVEGYGGIIIEVKKNTKGEYIIKPRRIPWDRLYYDPYSREKDFSDAAFKGITLWMDIDDAVALNPSKKAEIEAILTSKSEDETFGDRPNHWKDSERKRIRVNQEYYRKGDKWYVVYYSGDTVIIPPKESPYKDEDGLSMCPIEMDCDYIDRDNNRWGYMQRLIDVQDEINHRRSKALHMLSRKKVIADHGAFPEMTRSQVLAELAKAEAYLIKSPGTEVNIDDNQDLGQSQLAFYQDAKMAMDSIGTNPELSGRTQGAVSGRAYIARQQSGMVELANVFARHSNFKRRVFRQIWLRMRQFWTEEKWIRVSDNPNATKFVGINIPVTFLEQKLQMTTGKDIKQLIRENPRLEQEMQMAYQQDPRLGEVVETRNDVKELDMDITIEESAENAILQQEQFDTIANLAATRGDPQMFRALVMLSSIKGKKEVLEMLDGNEEQAAAQAQKVEQQLAIEMADKQSEIEERQSKTRKQNAEAEAQEIENALVESGVMQELEAAAGVENGQAF